jgi:transcriptional regulator with XRE-family HTH domain
MGPALEGSKMASQVFSEKLRQVREAAGLSAYALAKASGLSKQAVSTLESGASKPSWETVQKLAKALGVGCDAFMDGSLELPALTEPVKRGRPRKSDAPSAAAPAKKPRAKKGGTG